MECPDHGGDDGLNHYVIAQNNNTRYRNTKTLVSTTTKGFLFTRPVLKFQKR